MTPEQTETLAAGFRAAAAAARALEPSIIAVGRGMADVIHGMGETFFAAGRVVRTLLRAFQ